ncbi:MAG: PH domain-containing protein [Bdellovibrionales bacterium]|jgi:uncharacterized membrane protein YdbT with pleckstrin-like domain
MGSYVKRAMQPNESILYETQLHWVIYRMGITITFLGLLFGRFAPMPVKQILGDSVAELVAKPISYIAAVLIALGAFELLASFIRQISTELVITDQRVIAKHGFISTTSYELMMTKVEGATIEQSIWGRLLGFGTLMVKGTGGGISPIDHVADPYRFHSYLMNALHDAHAADAVRHHD